MNFFKWLSVLFSLVSLMEGVEATYPSSLIRSLGSPIYFGGYYLFLSRFIRKDILRKLPIPNGLLNYLDPVKETAIVSILEDNEYLIIGDALVDREGKVFFFMAPSKGDKVLSTLIRASSGLIEPNHKISEFILISRYDKESIWFMDYSTDPEINDKFKVVNHYGDYMLLGSTRNSMLFVAPSESTEDFLRGPFQSKLKILREREDRKRTAEKKTFFEAMGNNRIEKSTSPIHSQIQTKSNGVDSDFLVSPDSVAYGNNLLDSIFNIETLFGQMDGSTHLRASFINDRLVPMLLDEKLKLDDAVVLVKAAEFVFSREKMVEHIKVGEGETLTVVGDIHGQFLDLLRILKNCGWPDDERKFLFNGDIVDRGRESIECLVLLYALKITYPKSVFINRGNHETEMCGPGTFSADCNTFDASGGFFRTCQNGFYRLPLAHVINNRIYVVHGGVRDDYLIHEIAKMNRLRPDEFTKSYMIASMWDDPSELQGINPNRARGPCSFLFGPDVTESFLQVNRFDFMIRSHSYVPNGIKVSQDGKCWTLFSASNYCGMGNTAAVVTFDNNLVPEFGHFKPQKSLI